MEFEVSTIFFEIEFFFFLFFFKIIIIFHFPPMFSYCTHTNALTNHPKNKDYRNVPPKKRRVSIGLAFGDTTVEDIRSTAAFPFSK